MSPSNRPDLPDTLAVGREVDSLCDRFEEAWRRGERPDLDACLPAEGSVRALVLIELARLDLHYRLKAGQNVRAEDYFDRYPELRSDTNAAVALIATEFQGRALREPSPSPEEYRRRFPDLIDHSDWPTPLPGMGLAVEMSMVSPAAAAVAKGPSQTLTDLERGEAPPLPAGASPVLVPGYELLGELGRGGMGIVYKALQIKANRLVALKMIRSGSHAGKAELARFRTEVEAIARMQHPHIVQVYEVGESEGRPFFSLEYCPGGSLDKKLAGTPLPPHDAARLVETLARAMAAAHRQNVIHRDLKPANVLLTADGSPKITDFGLAKKLDDAAQTQSGAILGTPSYMAPEQASGQGKEVSALTDVYALGAILYECLTGRPPFKAATVMDTMIQVISDDPVPPTQLNAKVPRDLETVCLKCLKKESSRRYPSAQALGDDLGRFLRGEAIQARPVGLIERAWHWCRRRKAIAGTLLALALTIFLGTAGVWYFALQTYQKAQELDALRFRVRDVTKRLVVYLNNNPELLGENPELLIGHFLQDNQDISREDLDAVFRPKPLFGKEGQAGESGGDSASSYTPRGIFGD